MIYVVVILTTVSFHNYVKDMLKLELYFDDPRYKKRLETLSEIPFVKITII